jgi:protein-export chaperone SecB
MLANRHNSAAARRPQTRKPDNGHHGTGKRRQWQRPGRQRQRQGGPAGVAQYPDAICEGPVLRKPGRAAIAARARQGAGHQHQRERQRQSISGTEFDVLLSLNAQASFEKDKDVLFNIELVYGGVFRVEGFPQEHMLPILFIECPRLLFPFARQIVAECSRNGGFPPLMIDPIDFAQMFQQRMAEEQARQKVQAT